MPSLKLPLIGLLLTYLCMWSCNVHAQHPRQNEVDSLIEMSMSTLPDTAIFDIYRQLFRLHYQRDLEKSKIYLHREVEVAESIGIEKYIYLAKVHEGIYAGISRNQEDALRIFTELKDYYQRIGDVDKYGGVLTNLATTHLDLGNYKLALEYAMEGLRIDEERGLEGLALGKDYFTIGNIHRMSENTSVSNRWFYKALKEYKKDNAEMYVSQVYFTLGTNYLQLDSLEKAEPMLEEATTFFRKTNNKMALSVLIGGLGRCALKKGNLAQALALYSEALEMVKAIGNKNREMEFLANIGTVQIKRGEFKEAIGYLTKAIEEADELGLRANRVNYLEALSEALGGNRQYEEAYQTINSYIELKDSITEEDNLVALTELETKYQAEKKEQEIKLLEEKDKRSTLEKRAMILGLLSLILIFAAVLYGMRQRIKSNKIAKEKVDLALEMSHKELEYSQKELALRQKELTAYALQLAHKNEVLEEIKTNVSDAKNSIEEKAVQQIIRKIGYTQNDDNSWEEFRSRFQVVHRDFERKVLADYPEVSTNDLRLMALLKLNLSSKEVANILNISQAGIKKSRYRLRKKLNLSTGESLDELVHKL